MRGSFRSRHGQPSPSPSPARDACLRLGDLAEEEPRRDRSPAHGMQAATWRWLIVHRTGRPNRQPPSHGTRLTAPLSSTVPPRCAAPHHTPRPLARLSSGLRVASLSPAAPCPSPRAVSQPATPASDPSYPQCRPLRTNPARNPHPNSPPAPPPRPGRSLGPTSAPPVAPATPPRTRRPDRNDSDMIRDAVGGRSSANPIPPPPPPDAPRGCFVLRPHVTPPDEVVRGKRGGGSALESLFVGLTCLDFLRPLVDLWTVDIYPTRSRLESASTSTSTCTSLDSWHRGERPHDGEQRGTSRPVLAPSHPARGEMAGGPELPLGRSSRACKGLDLSHRLVCLCIVMMLTSDQVVVPVAVLAAVAAAMLIFICWWFPRAWARGQASDEAEYDEARRRREAAVTDADADADADVERAAGHAAPPRSAAIRRAHVPSPVAPY
ncbi:unnamed protein product [Diplocarpon coronariae]